MAKKKTNGQKKTEKLERIETRGDTIDSVVTHWVQIIFAVQTQADLLRGDGTKAAPLTWAELHKIMDQFTTWIMKEKTKHSGKKKRYY